MFVLTIVLVALAGLCLILPWRTRAQGRTAITVCLLPVAVMAGFFIGWWWFFAILAGALAILATVQYLFQEPNVPDELPVPVKCEFFHTTERGDNPPCRQEIKRPSHLFRFHLAALRNARSDAEDRLNRPLDPSYREQIEWQRYMARHGLKHPDWDLCLDHAEEANRRCDGVVTVCDYDRQVAAAGQRQHLIGWAMVLPLALLAVGLFYGAATASDREAAAEQADSDGYFLAVAEAADCKEILNGNPVIDAGTGRPVYKWDDACRDRWAEKSLADMDADRQARLADRGTWGEWMLAWARKTPSATVQNYFFSDAVAEADDTMLDALVENPNLHESVILQWWQRPGVPRSILGHRNLSSRKLEEIHRQLEQAETPDADALTAVRGNPNASKGMRTAQRMAEIDSWDYTRLADELDSVLAGPMSDDLARKLVRRADAGNDWILWDRLVLAAKDDKLPCAGTRDMVSALLQDCPDPNDKECEYNLHSKGMRNAGKRCEAEAAGKTSVTPAPATPPPAAPPEEAAPASPPEPAPDASAPPAESTPVEVHQPPPAEAPPTDAGSPEEPAPEAPPAE